MLFNLELIRQIGRGGMAEVWLAFDRKMGRYVAVKRLQSGVAEDRQIFDRFLQEAEALSRLSSDHVVRLLEHGQHDDEYWIVLEYVAGGDLHSCLEHAKGRVERRSALAILIDIARGLAAAHEAGIIHRDLKPGNVLLDRRGLAKISDLGLVRLQDAISPHSRLGQVAGTPGYMAPEILRGSPATVASDLYSLGVIAHRLLLGCTPGKHPSNDPSRSTVLIPRLSPSLDDLMSSLVDPNPSSRPAHVHAVLSVLETELGHPSSGNLVNQHRDLIRAAIPPGRDDELESSKPTAVLKPRRNPRRLRMWFGALLVSAVVLFGLVSRLREATLPSHETRAPRKSAAWVQLRLAPAADIALGDSIIATGVSDDLIKVPASSALQLRARHERWGWVDLPVLDVAPHETLQTQLIPLWGRIRVEASPETARVVFPVPEGGAEPVPAVSELGLGTRSIWVRCDSLRLAEVICRIGSDPEQVSWSDSMRSDGYRIDVPIAPLKTTNVFAVFRSH